LSILFSMLFTRKSAFTIVELIIAIFLLSVWVMWVLMALTGGMDFVQKTRERVIAINLAREWMEAVYNIRDTNRQLRAGKRESCWLKSDSFWNVWDLDDCADDPWIWSGYYVLLHKKIGWQKYFALSGFAQELDTSDWIQSGDLVYSLCQSWQFWTECPGQMPDSNEWYFFRQIVWKWVYLKWTSTLWWDKIDCVDWNWPDVECGSWSAKEFRFCSIVKFVWDSQWQAELCGMMTNFEE